MATLTVRTIDRDGLDPQLVAADAAGDKFPNTGNEHVLVKNDNASPVVVTLDIQSQLDGQAVTDRTVSVPAGEMRLIGPFPKNWYNDADDNANISYDDETSVTVGVFKLSNT